MIELAASETTVLIAVGAATALVFALGTLIVVAAVFAVFDGSEEAVRDVQRFVELTEEARSLLPRGPALADPNGEASAAIGRFLSKKEEARRALWGSRQTPSGKRPEGGDRRRVPGARKHSWGHLRSPSAVARTGHPGEARPPLK
jgi:hypothetical protein